MELGLEDRAGIVTGASRGIGLATARALAAASLALDVTDPDAGERLSPPVTSASARSTCS